MIPISSCIILIASFFILAIQIGMAIQMYFKPFELRKGNLINDKPILSMAISKE